MISIKLLMEDIDMGTETQDNWNKFFGNRRTPSNNNGLYIFIAALIVILVIIFTASKDGLPNSFVNGFGYPYNDIDMKNMVSSINDIIQENDNYMDEFINMSESDYDFIDEWSAFVNDSLNEFEEITYDPSFSSYIQAVKETLHLTDQFLTGISNKSLDPINIGIGIHKIMYQSDLVTDELLYAFDVNHIPYTIDEDGTITYSYVVH